MLPVRDWWMRVSRWICLFRGGEAFGLWPLAIGSMLTANSQKLTANSLCIVNKDFKK